MFSKIKILFEDIKFSHTVFALPFALMSAFIASEGLPSMNKIIWVLLAMVGARSAAMACNRIVDAKYDALNPRTKNRALPSKKINRQSYLFFLLGSIALFVFSAYQLNSLAFFLSPVALSIVFFYSWTKRFTVYSHFYLGLALSLAPVGAWVAVREDITITPLILGAAVIFWLAGFDIIYACQDIEFDKQAGLLSIPEKFGVEKALKLSSLFHLIMVTFLMLLLLTKQLGWVYLSGIIIVSALLLYEHSIVRPNDLSKINVAFFNVNGQISVLLMVLTIIDCTLV